MTIRRPMTAAVIAAGCVLTSAVAATATGAAPALPRAAARFNSYRSLCAPPADTVGPTVSKITFGRSSIDVGSSSRTQTVRVTAADTSGNGDPSGVGRIMLEVQGNGSYNSVRPQLTSGTPASGVWTGRFTLSKYGRPGTYSVAYVLENDKAGNQQSYPGYGGVPETPNALSLHPDDNPKFTLTGTPATPPPSKPAGTLRSFSFTPTSVNTTSATKLVHVTAHFAGAGPTHVSVDFSTDKRAGGRFAFAHGVLGHHPGVWSGTVRVPRWIGKATMRPYLYASWPHGYRPSARNWAPDDLAARNFPTKLVVVSGIDADKPTVSSLTLSPRPVDSTSGPVTVAVTAKVHDVGSGVHFVDVNGSIQNGVNGVAAGAYPFASAGIGYASSSYFSARLHPNLAGKWVGTATIRQCVPSGTYKLSVNLADAAGNYRNYSTRQLATANLLGTLNITSRHGDVAAPYVYSAATYGAESLLLVNFSEGVAHVDTTTLTVYPMAPASSRYSKPADVTSIVCANGKQPVDCSGSAGLVTSAKLVVPSLETGKQYQVFADQNQVVPQLVDGNRNPMDWNYPQAQVQDS